jgi:hypothetical protein
LPPWNSAESPTCKEWPQWIQLRSLELSTLQNSGPNEPLFFSLFLTLWYSVLARGNRLRQLLFHFVFVIYQTDCILKWNHSWW